MLPAVKSTSTQAPEFAEQIEAAGVKFGKANVVGVYCVHGTFAGNDALGLLTELARFAPGTSKSLSRLGKQTVDWVAGETGNYTPAFVSTMQAGLSAGAGRTLPVQLFNWSSQNNHIGRADGAIRLIDEVARFAESLNMDEGFSSEPPRLVLWGHSHGGNVFSLLTNLLGSDSEARNEFFKAARSFYQPYLRSKVDLPVWPHVQELLENPEHPLRRVVLDVVTFGTPVRYGWDACGYGKLMHFIHHRPPAEAPEYLAPRPIESRRLLVAADGDYIQQIGIAGTNLIPNIFAIRTLIADWRLDKFLERDVVREQILTRLRRRTRVPEEGTTLLVDYQGIESGVHNHLAGHALYTRRKWLPFHLGQVAEQFYGGESDC